MNSRFPLRHLSIRVPWHDNGWKGCVCTEPSKNTACLRLENICRNRNDTMEEKMAGKAIESIPQSEWPPCVAERGTFMSPHSFTRLVTHPYVTTSPETHGHLQPAAIRQPPFSAPAIPFLWMRKERLESNRKKYELSIDVNREPELSFERKNGGWVQELLNQKALLDCFFNHIEPEKSLCFFYAKQVPLVENAARVLIGVGRVLHVASGVEYPAAQKRGLRSMAWDRVVQHSIREDCTDGFLLPYKEAIELAKRDASFDPASIAVITPPERQIEFSFASEHVTHDAAIDVLLKCSKVLSKAQKLFDGPWSSALGWIDCQLTELWKLRGLCPSLGACLSAFGVTLGNLVAWELSKKLKGPEDNPWPLVDKMFDSPTKYLPTELAEGIGTTLRKIWNSLPEERRSLLKLLSRFEITAEQAKLLYVAAEREKAGIDLTDKELLKNPYLAFELTRETAEPISVWTIDKGLFSKVSKKHKLFNGEKVFENIDPHRIRALSVNTMEQESSLGHTIITGPLLIQKIRELEIEPECPITEDSLSLAEKSFTDAISKEMADGQSLYQLTRLAKCRDIIRTTVEKRLGGKRYALKADWRSLIDTYLDDKVLDKEEDKARIEKTSALRELAESRFTVLVGPAGTGKTTLLSVFCDHPDIVAGGILLLAPTGKARVRIEQASKLKAQTIAQFLGSRDRFDGETQIYHLSEQPPQDVAETLIIDEASMLTEEMLAAIFESIKGVKRIILVGDVGQLPPIGSGRPFVDILRKITPQNIEQLFPRVASAYVELTVTRRQKIGKIAVRGDLQLAGWFRGQALAPRDDEVFSAILSGKYKENIEAFSWESADDLQALLTNTLIKELKLKDSEDVVGFGKSLGGVPDEQNKYIYFNRGSAKCAEGWQILSPVRGLTHGVRELNRYIHKQFCREFLKLAHRHGWAKIIPKPMGPEEIVYGDKVINIKNHKRLERWPGGPKLVYPEKGARGYVANGEIGIAVGQFKTSKMKFTPYSLKIEFASQQSFEYEFTEKDFESENEPILELAYALTVHKAQGSDFDIVVLILPSQCALLSRELLYTALSRQRSRLVILHQGDLWDYRKYSSDVYSETARRRTNLFVSPDMVQAGEWELERGLVHLTSDGTAVHSKNEVIIYETLRKFRLQPSYEKPLRLGNEVRLPDFTIVDEDSGKTFYWEHCGMLEQEDYRNRWLRKLKLYREHGIIDHAEGEGENGILIITEDGPDRGISVPEIESLIKKVILKQP